MRRHKFILISVLILSIGLILTGLYFGIWWAFIGGSKQLIAGFSVHPFNAANIIWGLGKVILGWTVSLPFIFAAGWIAIVFCVSDK